MGGGEGRLFTHTKLNRPPFFLYVFIYKRVASYLEVVVIIMYSSLIRH
jgi:hypothetical protein